MSGDPYLYEDSEILQNLQGLRTQRELDLFERLQTAARARQALPAGDFSYAHLKAIHWHLFQDVYDWAGDERIVEMVKGDTLFCPSEHIDQRMTEICDDLAAEYHLVGLEPQVFAEKAAHVLCDINAAHPFREGNGRAQRAFLGLLAGQAGYPLDYSRIEPAQMLAASIAGMRGDERPTADLLKLALAREPEVVKTVSNGQTPEQQRIYTETLERLRRRSRTRDADDLER